MSPFKDTIELSERGKCRFLQRFDTVMGVQLQRNNERSSARVGGVEHLPEGLRFPVLLAAAMQADLDEFIGHTGFKLLSECEILSTDRHFAIAFQRLSQRNRTADRQEAFRASPVSNPTPSSYPPAPPSS
jgi:phytoene/squalene synthetase